MIAQSSLQALNAVQDGVGSKTQVPVEVLVADRVVEGDSLRAFEGLVLQCASDADALLCVGDRDEAVKETGSVTSSRMELGLPWRLACNVKGVLGSMTY